MAFKIAPQDWTLDAPHGVAESTRRWRVTGEGILVSGEPKVRRTPGPPKTLQHIEETYGTLLADAAAEFSVAHRFLSAVMATESGGRLPADRYEQAIDDWSYGLMQTLTETAAGLIRDNRAQFPGPFPKPKDFAAWKTYLDVPRNSIRLGAAYLRAADHAQSLRGDPMFLYAAYNAGSACFDAASEWGLVAYGHALDNLAAFYGDACALPG